MTSGAVIDECEIFENTAGEKGGGVEARSNTLIRNCIIYKNKGGGVSSFGNSSNITILNCTIADNLIAGATQQSFGGVTNQGAIINIINSIISNNESL